MRWQSIFGLIALATGLGSRAFSAPVPVPNASFESPATGFVSVNIDSWQKAPKPDWYVETGGFFWSQLIGIFRNTAQGSPDHIDNCDGNQAIWLFATPEVSLFQDYETLDWNDTLPTHAFDVTYEDGKSYQLTAGVIGSGGGMQQGATLELRFYYRDAATNRVPIAVTSITNATAVFSNNTHFLDFHVSVPTVQEGDPWRGKHLGIELASTVTTNLQGGYWDLDNVRLTVVEQLRISNPVSTNGQFQFTLHSAPGLAMEILSTTDAALPMAAWGSAGIITNTAGTVVFSDGTSDARRFYRVRPLSP